MLLIAPDNLVAEFASLVAKSKEDSATGGRRIWPKVPIFAASSRKIDDVVFGVKAIDRDGKESLVAPYVNGPRQKLEIDTYD